MKQKRKIKGPKKNSKILHLTIGVIMLLTLGFLVSTFTKNQTYQTNAVANTTFSFSVAGDYGHTSNTDPVLNLVKTSGGDFHIGLGDFAYSSGTPAQWAAYVKSIVGTEYPFELISGNHDDDIIDQYTSELPDRLNNISGTYAKEYYFDYPSATPSARFILLSPDLVYGYSYALNSPNYTWVANTIDNARSQGIAWVIVGMHKVCLSIGVKSCEIGTDLMDLLISKRVDLVLSGHDHNYQRTKQLSCATRNSYNSNCVANDTSSMTKGAGTVFVTNGAGGQGLYSINTADSEFGYYASWMGSNIDPTWGITKFTVAPNRIDANFLRASGGNFTDSFSIIDNTLPTTEPTPTSDQPTPTPDPLQTPTPTPLPTSTPTPLPTNTPTPTLQGGTFNLNPIADAYVYAKSANSNFGTKTTLIVDGSPIYLTYMKFDLSSLAGKTISSAKLKLRTVNSSKSTQIAKYVADNSWSETAITYNNRPALGSQITSFVGGSSGVWKEIDITSAIQANAGSVLSIGIDSTGGDGYDFSSRETTNKPVLTVIAN